MALNLEESNVGVILLDNVDKVTENMSVKRTGEALWLGKDRSH